MFRTCLRLARFTPGLAAVSLFVLGLAACSDDNGGGPTPTPPAPQNQAPAFSSAPVDATVEENTSAVLATIVASDPDGDTLTFDLEGDDAAVFRFDPANGALTFTTAPDFEAPGDANGDNIYLASLRASDPAGLSATLAISVIVTDVANETGPVRLRDLVFTDLAVEDNIRFATVDGQTLFLTVYTPVGDTATDRPVMLLASGGGFVEQERASVEPIAEDFARRGYVAATMDYRVLDQDPASADALAIAGATATQDMFAAVRFLRAEGEGVNPRGIRPDAIFVGGESAGAVMAMLAATLDPADPISRPALATFLNGNGGVFGTVGDNDAVSSLVQGLLALSGGVLDLATIDANSAVLYAAHEELDPVVPCGTAAEGASFTGLVISGGCDVVPAYGVAGATAQLFLVENFAGHVEFTEAQRRDIFQDAAELFFNTVISPSE